MRINEAYGQLTSVFKDWSPAIANPRGIRKGSQITWDSYKPLMLKQNITASDVIDLFNEGQYTFQVTIDGSLIQIYYQFDSRGNELQSARLAFYSAVADEQFLNKDENTLEFFPTFQSNIEDEANDLEAYESETFSEEYREETVGTTGLTNFKDSPISWLRIDYAPDKAKGVLHHACHMHLSSFPLARLVVAGVPTPRQFIEFIMAFCYPSIYEKHRLDSHGQYANADHILTINSNCVPLGDHNVFRQMAHFRIPIVSEGRRR